MSGVHGTDYYGKTEHVRGMFYVTTMFFHINYLPLWPQHSALLFEDLDRPTHYQGTDIPLNWKSVALGYLRGWLGALAIFLYMAGCLTVADCFLNLKQDFWMGFLAAMPVFFVVRHILLSETWDYWLALALLLAASAGVIGYCHLLAAQGAMPAKGVEKLMSLWTLALGGACLLLHGMTYLWSPPALEDAIDLGGQLGFEKSAIEKRVQGLESDMAEYAMPKPPARPLIGPPPGADV